MFFRTFILSMLLISAISRFEVLAKDDAKVITDDDGDKVDRLDFQNRDKLRQLFDDINKETIIKKTTEGMIEYYVVQKGDQLQSISEKLYGTSDRWNELLELNKDVIQGTEVTPGMRLKYMKGRQ